jgi:hypothetical protein
MADLSIKGLQEAQRWNARAIASLKPGGEMSRAIRDVITQIQRAEISLTHVDTGALRASIRMDVQDKTAKTFIDPAAVNPRGRQKTINYAGVENARGGEHAFAERTVRDYAPRIVGMGVQRIGRGLI